MTQDSIDSPHPRPGGRELGYHGDLRMVAGIRRGEQAALAAVYQRHGGRLHDLASRVCGLGRADAVVEQVLIDLWQDSARFDPAQSSLENFLVWQTHAQAVKVVRSRGSRPVRSLLRKRRPDVNRDLRAWLPERVGATAWRRLSALPDDERDAIALVYFCGHGPDELVSVLDESPEVWAKRIRAGLGRLGRQTRGDEPWPS